MVSEQFQVPINAPLLSDILHETAISGPIPDSEKQVAFKELEVAMREWRRALSMPVTTRSVALLDEYMESGGISQAIEGLIDGMMGAYIKKRQWYVPSPVAIIYQALALSPLKNVHMTRRVFGVTTLQAAQICFNACKIRNTGISASNALKRIRSVMGEEVAGDIINAYLGYQPSLFSQMSPITLSWLHGEAMSLALSEAMAFIVTSYGAWLELKGRYLHSAITTAYRHGVLRQISKF